MLGRPSVGAKKRSSGKGSKVGKSSHIMGNDFLSDCRHQKKVEK